MRITRSLLLIQTVICLIGLDLQAEPAPPLRKPDLVVPLWQGEPPLFQSDAPAEIFDPRGKFTNVTRPEIAVFSPNPDRNRGMAIIVCAGGGYGSLDWKTHVIYAADVFNPKGVTIIGLKYRTRPPFKGTNSEIQALTLLDAKRAVRLVRHRAKAWNINPRQIGIAGYSAGGNLAMNLAANFDAGTPDATDPIERESSRPDFAIGLATWHWRQKESPFQFSRNTPPVFLVHATNDGIKGGAPIELPREITADLQKLNVPVKLAVFDVGAHGVGNLIPRRVKRGFPPRKMAGSLPRLVSAHFQALILLSTARARFRDSWPTPNTAGDRPGLSPTDRD